MSLSIDQNKFPTMGDPWTFGPYRYCWTGLKPLPDHVIIVGQWVAWGSGLPYLYVTVPGFIGGVYYPGQVFNLTTRMNRMITPEQTPEEILGWIREGMGYLMELMDVFQQYPGIDMPLKTFFFPTELSSWQ